MNTEAATATSAAPVTTTTVDLVIRLQVKGSPTEVASYRVALQMLAEIMVVQAEEGLWSAGYEDGGDEEEPNEYVADIVRTRVQAILIEGSDTLTKEIP